MNASEKVIHTARKWNGYLEKKSSKLLDDFLANAGRNNYTCFARDYYRDTGINCQGQAWCAMFVSEVFVQAFGLEKARKLLGGSLYHYCPDGVNRFKAMGRFLSDPAPGAIIFFTNGARAYHTGIVTEVAGDIVKTIEGNTSGASGVVENGGGVCQKSYSKANMRIMGYGLPDWSIVGGGESTPACNPDMTVSLPSLVRGHECGYVKTLQQLLTAKGYNTNGVDGIFGSGTEKAVEAFQKAAGVKVSFPGTVGKKTWEALLKG